MEEEDLPFGRALDTQSLCPQWLQGAEVVLGREGPGLHSCNLGEVTDAPCAPVFSAVKWDPTYLPRSLCRLTRCTESTY